MSITRPTNSNGVQTITMPETTNQPDSSPAFLAGFWNRIFNSQAHLHDNGTTTMPPYLGEGGIWARPNNAGTQVNMFHTSDQKEVFWVNENGVYLPIGMARDASVVTTNLNQLMKEGLYWYDAAITGTTGFPSLIKSGNIWIQKSVRSSTLTHYHQVIFSDEGEMAYRRSVVTLGSAVSWSDWRVFSYTGIVSQVLSGIISPYSGSFGGQSNKHPINRRTGIVDLDYAICDGGTYTASDGVSVTTPDLRDRFIVGAGGGSVSGQTGGSASHSHTGSIGATTLTAAQMPSHTHSLYREVGEMGYSSEYGPTLVGATGFSRSFYYDFGATSATGSSGSHTHTMTTNNTDTRPPFYALAYIMKL